MFKLFIKRPILSGVISVIIVCLGVLSILTLPITQFPDIVPPSVTVTARYTGASADVMSKTVATPLERAINGVPGMTYMTTVCTNDGMSLTTIYFKVGTDPDVAAVNVQNRVTTVLDELPEEVIRAGVITEKEVNSMLMYLNIMSTDSAHTEKFVYNFADINILRELKRIDGVGLVEIMGSRDYAMRVWLNPNRLAAYNMVPQDVTEAIRNQNIEAAPGKTGISSDKLPQQLQYVLQYTGKFSTAEEYGEIVLKALPDGSLLRLKDVATIEFDSEDYNMTSMTDGRPSASIMIKQRPGSNAREVIQNIKTKMAEIKESSFAPGMDYNISYDVSRFLDASIQSVLKTLLEAFILVFIVVYFLIAYRKELESSPDIDKLAESMPSPAETITNRRDFALSCVIFMCAVVLLVTHALTGLTVAFIGLVIAIFSLIVSGRKALHMLKSIDYKTLLFFLGLFIVVGGLEQTGILEIIAAFIGRVSKGNLKLMVAIIIIISACASALIDNIPFAATMVPVIKSLAATQGVDLSVLAWALSMGTDVGGSATPIGASANVVGTSVAAKNGYMIGWGKYCRTAVPATIIVVLISMVCIFVRYC